MQDNKKAIVKACVITFLVTAFLFMAITVFRSGSGLGKRDASSIVDEVKMFIDAVYLNEYTDEELYRGAAKGMTDVLDQYTNYYTPTEFAEFARETTGSYVGVGLVMSQTTDGKIFVLQAYNNCPGAEAGVKAGDILLTVDGEKPADFEAAADALRGDGSETQGAGSVVKATFLRDGKEYEVGITRRVVHIETVASRLEDGGVGYFEVSGFDEDTDAEFKTHYEDLLAQGMTSIVVDLRDNGGGDFYTACRMAGMFLPEKATIVYRMGKDGKKGYEYAEGHLSDLPVVILANGNTASASEVLIGALKDNGRLAALVGTKTFGKGITQNVYSLPSGGGISITAERYYTAADRCIHGVGFEPDVLIESGFDENYPVAAISRDKDAQLNKALEVAKQK